MAVDASMTVHAVDYVLTWLGEGTGSMLIKASIDTCHSSAINERILVIACRLVVIEPILVLNLVRARSSWLGIGTEPPADRSPIRRRIV